MMESYPSKLKVDFTKLRANTLKRYAWHYNLPASRGGKTSELANTCANHFALHLEVNEAQVLAQFVEYCKNLGSGKGGAGDRGGKHSDKSSSSRNDDASEMDYDGELKKKAKAHPLSPGERVAAKIGKDWMLTRVLKYSKRKKMYKVEDADELTVDPAVYDVPQDSVIIIPKPDKPETLAREFPRGARVLALFPGTSTFYAATVAKKFERPKGKLNEYGLRFDDDEKDANGDVRMKRISAYDVVSPL